MLDHEIIKWIITLHHKGHPTKQIAKIVKVDVATARKYIQQHLGVVPKQVLPYTKSEKVVELSEEEQELRDLRAFLAKELKPSYMIG